MFLQILVPQYKEDERVISKLLDSIELQRNIDFKDIGVIIVNDGSDIILKHSWLEDYPFKIDYIKAEHKGVSATRNTALKATTADYIMFCDADDMFYHTLALQLIIRECKEKKPDCFYSTFVEETPDQKNPGKFIYNARQGAFVFVHGKVYRRQFLIDNDIYWDEELTLHEDGYFNGLALAQVKKDKLVYCNEPFYMWCDNKESVSRKTPTFVLDTYIHNLVAQDRLITKLLPKNIYEAINLSTNQLYQTYLLLTGDFLDLSKNEKQPIQFREKLTKELNDVDDALSNFYDKFKDCYKHTIQKERERLFTNIKASCTHFNSKDSSLEDFENWLIEFKKRHNIEFDDTPIELPKAEEKKDDNIIDAEVVEEKPAEEKVEESKEENK